MTYTTSAVRQRQFTTAPVATWNGGIAHRPVSIRTTVQRPAATPRRFAAAEDRPVNRMRRRKQKLSQLFLGAMLGFTVVVGMLQVDPGVEDAGGTMANTHVAAISLK